MSLPHCRISFQAWCGTRRMPPRTHTGQYDSQLLQLWTSTMFIAGAVAGQFHLLQCMHACSRRLLCSQTHLSVQTYQNLLLLMICTVTAGLVAALVTRRYGRRLTMVVGKLICCSSNKHCRLDEATTSSSFAECWCRWPGISHWNWPSGWSCAHQHALPGAGLSRHWRWIC